MMKLRRSIEKRRHIAGLLRVLGYFTVVGLGCGALSVRAARAEVVDQSLAVGRQMMALANAETNDVTQITLNGQGMFLGSSLSQEPVDKVLDRFAEHCKKNAAQSPEAWRALGTGGKVSGESIAEHFNDGVLRGGGKDEGTVVCFVRTNESKPSIVEAFKTFGETGELDAIGSLRYVYAKKTSQGNTHILTSWTLSKFNLMRLVPNEHDDVPGSDFAEVPRPEGSQRVLSARVEGTPFGANVYRSDQPPGDVAAFFDRTLIGQGWFALDAEVDKHMDTRENHGVGHLYEKDGVVLTLASKVDEGKTMTALGLAGVIAHAHR